MKMPAGQFKTKCLKIMDELQQTREEVTVTKHGKPVAKLIPYSPDSDSKRPIFGFMKDVVRIHADIVTPLEDKWDAES